MSSVLKEFYFGSNFVFKNTTYLLNKRQNCLNQKIKVPMFFLNTTSHSDITVICIYNGFPGGSEVKASAHNAGDPSSILSWEEPLEKEMATHSSILAWRTHGRRSLVGYSPQGRRVGHD